MKSRISDIPAERLRFEDERGSEMESSESDKNEDGQNRLEDEEEKKDS